MNHEVTIIFAPFDDGSPSPKVVVAALKAMAFFPPDHEVRSEERNSFSVLTTLSYLEIAKALLPWEDRIIEIRIRQA